MATEKFDEGLEITIPPDFKVTKTQAPKTRRSAKLRVSGAVAMPTNSGRTRNNDLILESLERIGMELIHEIDIKPVPQTTARRGRSAATRNIAEFKVDLPQDEDAVLLFEQDGMYLWKYASESHTAPLTPRRGARTEATQKRLVFRVEITSPTEPTTPRTSRALLSEIKEFAWGKVKAYVLKFTASVTVEVAKKYLERNISRGTVRITSTSPGDWSLMDDLKELNLPEDRTPRILLLVHGTFSSTAGAYGALCGTPWGESLISSALKNYDAIIGFNHATLSEDPLQNAQQLLAKLQGINWQFAPAFDVIAHSRGGLVIRSLIEKLLPQSNWRPKFNRVVFVACTNEGTTLAEPENWESLVNTYTNLAVGACRIVGLISPQSKAVTVVLGDAIESIGSFVKYCADSAVTDRIVPGLSAMEPDGAFIKDINLFQTGQPAIGDSYYCAITSEFKPHLTGDHEPQELPKRFLQLLAGGFIGGLMHEASDLVVNTKSMGAIDTQTGNYIKESYDFGENPQVYHTNYFTRPEVANALAGWFGLPPIQLKAKGRDPHNGEIVSRSGKRGGAVRRAGKRGQKLSTATFPEQREIPGAKDLAMMAHRLQPKKRSGTSRNR